MAPRPRATPDSLIWLVSALLGATGAALWAFAPPALPHLTPHLWWPAVAGLYALTCRLRRAPAVRPGQPHPRPQPGADGARPVLPDHRRAGRWPHWSGLGFVQLVVRRNPPIKLAFNMASMLAQVPLACLVFAAMLDLFNVQAGDMTAAGLAGHADRGTDRRRAGRGRCLRHHQPARPGLEPGSLPRTLGIVAIGTFVVTDLALVTVLVVLESPLALALLAVLAVLSYVLYRGLPRAAAALRPARAALPVHPVGRPGAAERVGDGDGAGRGLRPAAGAADAIRGARPAHADRLVGRACQGKPCCCSHAGTQPGVRRCAAAEGHVDAMAAPLRDGGQITGVLLVTDRLDDVSTFDKDDLELFEALAGHASVALTNSGLVDRVRAAAAGDRAPVAARPAHRPAQPAALPAAAGEAAAARPAAPRCC